MNNLFFYYYNLIFYILQYKNIYTFQNFTLLTKNIIETYVSVVIHSLGISNIDYGEFADSDGCECTTTKTGYVSSIGYEPPSRTNQNLLPRLTVEAFIQGVLIKYSVWDNFLYSNMCFFEHTTISFQFFCWSIDLCVFSTRSTYILK